MLGEACALQHGDGDGAEGVALDGDACRAQGVGHGRASDRFFHLVKKVSCNPFG